MPILYEPHPHQCIRDNKFRSEVRLGVPNGTVWQCPDCGQRWARLNGWLRVSERRANRIIRKFSRYDKPEKEGRA